MFGSKTHCLGSSNNVLVFSNIVREALTMTWSSRTLSGSFQQCVFLLEHCSGASNNVSGFPDNVGRLQVNVVALRSLLERVRVSFKAPSMALTPPNNVGGFREEDSPSRTMFEGFQQCGPLLRQCWRPPEACFFSPEIVAERRREILSAIQRLVAAQEGWSALEAGRPSRTRFESRASLFLCLEAGFWGRHVEKDQLLRPLETSATGLPDFFDVGVGRGVTKDRYLP